MTDETEFHTPEGLQDWLRAAIADSLPKALAVFQGDALLAIQDPTPGSSGAQGSDLDDSNGFCPQEALG
ncbi:Hypothetical predicted protein, partial [Pelobates cultripes]